MTESSKRPSNLKPPYKLGDTLPNGATVICNKGVVVLAAKQHMDDGAVAEYVTWLIDEKGRAYGGHYFSPATLQREATDEELRLATLDFASRCEAWYPPTTPLERHSGG